ncbi:MAG: DUF2178 domain-containing protein [Candidatus Altiarchaeales archaeon]|nr:DUF2178 domain-containing protein [Candidatus Altiarchaeales archaeon]MBD3417071.1 DUF2178 domain-containing protein [Candidatus Altiarchaeales archaeon]
MMDVRLRIVLVLALVAAVSASLGLYAVSAWPLDMVEVGGIGIAFTIVLIGLVVVLGMWDSMKKGEPLRDEMTVKIVHKAGYYTWMITIYLCLIVGWFIDDIPGMMPRHGATAVLLLSCATYFIVLAVMKVKGE